MSSNSLRRYAYYVSFIDDFSRKKWVYFMKNKDEVFSKFNKFKALIENHTEKKFKTFQSDNGGEFTSDEFKELCRESGIRRELTIPYNPKHNGVSKRKNRTIMEATKAMLHDQDLPMRLWAEVVRTTVYVQNHTLHRILEKKTPEESRRILLWKETKSHPSQNIWLPGVCTHSERKEDEVRSFRKEGYICGI